MCWIRMLLLLIGVGKIGTDIKNNFEKSWTFLAKAAEDVKKSTEIVDHLKAEINRTHNQHLEVNCSNDFINVDNHYTEETFSVWYMAC